MVDYENEAADVRSRINQLLKEKGITQNAVADGDAPVQKRLNAQLSHGRAISLDTVLRILSTFPDVSAEWLLRGSGDMCKAATITGANRVTGRNATVIVQQQATGTLSEDFIREIIAEKDKQIQTLLEILKR